MIPKYKHDEKVKFKCNNEIKEGNIYIIDEYGTFEQSEEVSYDIFVEKENTLYKHIRESLIT